MSALFSRMISSVGVLALLLAGGIIVSSGSVLASSRGVGPGVTSHSGLLPTVGHVRFLGVEFGGMCGGGGAMAKHSGLARAHIVPNDGTQMLSVHISKINDDQRTTLYQGGTSSAHTIDGNLVRVGGYVLNCTTSDKSGSVAILLADGGTITTSESETVKASQGRFFSGVMSSDGWAWGDNGATDERRTLYATFAGTRSQENAQITVLPRPVILIHGLAADYTTWKQWYAPAASSGSYLCSGMYPHNSDYSTQPHAGPPGPDSQGRSIGPPGWQDDWCGFPVTNLNTSETPTTSISQDAENLAAYIKTVRDFTGADRVDLVAHSMGGLIAREYINDLMPRENAERAQPVTRLVMLGTPNQGSNTGTVGSLFRILDFSRKVIKGLPPEPATKDNSVKSLKAFNRRITDRKNVNFEAISGDFPLRVAGLQFCVSLDGSPSDGVVNLNHVPVAPGDDVVAMPVYHSAAYPCPGGIGAETESSAAASKVLSSWLEYAPMASPIGGAMVPPSRALPQTHTGNDAQSFASKQGVASPIITAQHATLAPGQSVTLQAQSAAGAPDLNAVAGVSLDPTATRPLLTLRSPGGTVSIPKSPQKDAGYSDASNTSGDLPPFLGFSVANPAAGPWTLTVTNPANSNQKPLTVNLLFSTDSTTGLSVDPTTTSSIYVPGQTISLTTRLAQVMPNGNAKAIPGKSGASITARVMRLGASFPLSTLTLTDDGTHGDGAANDSLYGVTFPAPTQVGEYGVIVTAISGSAQRMEATLFSVAPTSTLMVQTSADPASCPTTPRTESPLSLRCAIAQANKDNGMDTILFNIPASDAHCTGGGPVCTISPASALPAIAAAHTVVDGSSQPGSLVNNVDAADNAVPAIRLDGAGAGAGADGLSVTASDVTVCGLEVTRFGRAGISVSGSGVNGGHIEGNLLGTNGAAALGNGYYGVEVSGGAQNITIGGIERKQRNLLSGNGPAGIIVHDSGTSHNLIIGNMAGTDATGYSAVPNAVYGVWIKDGASLNTVGGSDPNDSNLLSGNAGAGVGIEAAANNTVLGNLIGTDPTGAAALLANPPNVETGVNILGGATSNTVGGIDPGDGNVISGNGAGGIAIHDPGTTSNAVYGNKIGTDLAGEAAVRNGDYGVALFNGASANTIGGSIYSADGFSPGGGNVISGNADEGIAIRDAGTSNNIVSGNMIGTDVTGEKALPNQNLGVRIYLGATNNSIGAFTVSNDPLNPHLFATNIISGNGGSGVLITDIGTTGNGVGGNYIGLDASGQKALANAGDGVAVKNGATGDVIGSVDLQSNLLPEGNVISGNTGNGVELTGGGGNSVTANIIGEDPSAFFASIPNGANGVYAHDGELNDTITSNTIADNTGAGVLIGSSASDTGTHVGLTGNPMSGNGGPGIDIAPAGITCGGGAGPNDNLACPVITSATTTGVSGTACAGCTVELFTATNETSALGHGEGVVTWGTTQADGQGKWGFGIGFNSGTYLTATASTAPTTPSANTPLDTSEFAANVAVP